MTQVETLEELPAMVDDVRRLWIETAFAQGMEIPLPSYREDYSGKFNLRLPRSLHRSLAEESARQGVRLNQYVVALLAERNAQAQIERRLDVLERRSAQQRIDASDKSEPSARRGSSKQVIGSR